MIIKEHFAESIGRFTREAGQRIMVHYAGARQSRAKEDHSPVTDADIEAHRLIFDALKALAPEIPIISEEDENLAALTSAPLYWLVDPLDGTRSFVRGSGEFTVNIGLIRENYPIMGAIYIPQRDALYIGEAGKGAYCLKPGQGPCPVRTRPTPAEGMTVVKSSHHTSPGMEELLGGYKVAHVASASSSVKFCRVAEGEADLYPRLGRTMEWDTAAGQAILEAAGGRVETLDGKRLIYGKPDFINPGFICFGN